MPKTHVPRATSHCYITLQYVKRYSGTQVTTLRGLRLAVCLTKSQRDCETRGICRLSFSLSRETVRFGRHDVFLGGPNVWTSSGGRMARVEISLGHMGGGKTSVLSK